MTFFRKTYLEHWKSYEYCAIDVEATGLDLRRDEVISIGAAKIIEGRFKGVGNFYEEIAPSIKPSHSSIEIHGLRGMDLESAKPASLVMPELVTYLSGCHLIAHASWVEKGFLSKKLRDAGYKYPKRVVDTAALARFVGVAEKGSGHEPSLEHLARTLNLPLYTPHHALGDAMTTAAVFLALATRIEKELVESSGEILTLERLLNISKD